MITAYTDEWKPIPGYEGRYEVSATGEVRSLLRNRVLKQAVVGGRPRVTLYSEDGRKDSPRVHTLVLLAFVGPCPAGHMSCHADDDPLNNTVENLRWGTESDNAEDRVKNGRHNMARKTHCPQNHPYDEENTGTYAGHRYCRECRRQHSRKYRREKK